MTSFQLSLDQLLETGGEAIPTPSPPFVVRANVGRFYVCCGAPAGLPGSAGFAPHAPNCPNPNVPWHSDVQHVVIAR